LSQLSFIRSSSCGSQPCRFVKTSAETKN
jgi:hypothetical protein